MIAFSSKTQTTDGAFEQNLELLPLTFFFLDKIKLIVEFFLPLISILTW